MTAPNPDSVPPRVLLYEGGKTWRILAATVNGARGGQAMLTAGR